VPRTCTICSHPRVLAINEALVQNEAHRRVSKRFGASASAMYRHMQEHLPATRNSLVDNAPEVATDGTLLAKITRLEAEARRLGKKAEDAGDFRGAMAAVRELVRIVELLAKLQGEIQEPTGTTVNVVYVNSPSLGLSERTRSVADPSSWREPARSVTPSASSATVDVETSRRNNRAMES
jgi:hypothetical protein